MKLINKITKISLVLLSSTLTMNATDNGNGIDVVHASENNTLVRVIQQGKYLMLPVQESIDDAKVNVLVNGNHAKTFYVRLAKNKIDYYVPFDMSNFNSNEGVLFDITTNQNRSSVREVREDVCWKNIKVAQSFDATNTEKFRPAFHHTPLYGWMNDPNGMFYKDGTWHLYYQYNPYGSKWQNMTWGHSTSTDLINWKHEPLAIEPIALGTIFSGSCVVDHNNSAGYGKDAVIAFYTCAGNSQVQCLAHSDDNGMTFTNYNPNPIIVTDGEARDPNVFWNKETGRWNMLLAHALEHEMLILSSADLKNWTLESAFGKIGAQDGVWECPDLLNLKVEGTNKTKWVLICNLNPGGVFGGSATQYFVGDFDGKNFTVDNPANVPTKWLDYGKDHYATVSWSNAPDNRSTVIGWMSNWQYGAAVPTQQFRSANTLPRDLKLFKDVDGEYYVSVVPSPEVDALRGTPSTYGATVLNENPHSFNLPSANDGICEINLTFNAGKSKVVNFSLSNEAGEHVDFVYDVTKSTVSMDRNNSGITDFSLDFPAVTVAPTHSAKKGQLSLRIFIDRSSIELFEAKGRFAMTNLVFPTKPYSTITVSTDGSKATLSSLSIYPLTPSENK
jgi:sucrose-6-phosphate hydrolase SacC (GH32 family)